MTFPVGRPTEHPALPRRPERTSQRTDRHTQRFSKKRLNEWCRRIDVTDRLCISDFFQGECRIKILFGPDEIPLLEQAIARSRQPGAPLEVLGRVPFDDFAGVRISAQHGQVRIHVRQSERSGGGVLRCFLDGRELAAFERAVEAFSRQINAATAANEKQVSK